MAIPASEVNIIGTHVYAGSDLGLTASLTSAQTGTSTPFSTATGATVIVISQLSSGSATAKIQIADTAADISYGSPAQTVSLSGTSPQVIVQETTTASTYFGIQIGPGASGCVFDTSAGKQGLKVFVLYERVAGQEWFNVASSINMILSQVNALSHSGDSGLIATGSGNVPNAFTKPEDAL